MTNQMGDVIAITEADGNLIVEYAYDSWGKLLGIYGRDDEYSEQQLANANPLRYRGYYYDSETGYYYLQSRYYDPNICRFINADIPEIAGLSKDISVGTNLFAYCNNNLVNDSDPTGSIALSWALKTALGGLIGIACYLLSWLFFKRFTKEKFSVGELLKNFAIGLFSGFISYFNINKITSFCIDFAINFVSLISRGCNLLEVFVVALIVSIVSSLLSFGINKLFSHFKKFGVSSKKIAKYDNQLSSAWKKSIKKNNYKIIKDMIHTYFRRMKTTLNRYITINTVSGMFGQAFDRIRKIAKDRRLTC